MPVSKIKILVVIPTPKNKSSGSLITLRNLCFFKIRFICSLLVFSNFLSGNINAHCVCVGTLFRTFSTILIQPYFFHTVGSSKPL